MPKYNRGVSFPDDQVEDTFKPFTDFYFTNLHITSHLNEISGIMLEPLYRILSGDSVNVGNVIYQNLLKRRHNPHLVLCYPGLIWRMCERAGVDLSGFDRDLDMGSAIELPEHYPGVFDFRQHAPSELSEGSIAPARPPRPAPKQNRCPTKRPRSTQAQSKRRPAQQVIPTPISNQTPRQEPPQSEQPPSRSAQPSMDIPIVSEGTFVTEFTNSLHQ